MVLSVSLSPLCSSLIKQYNNTLIKEAFVRQNSVSQVKRPKIFSDGSWSSFLQRDDLEYSYFAMNKRISQKKLNGEIILMQTELMSKLASISEPKKITDQLGFALSPPTQQSDALLDLLSKSKNITQKHAKQIEVARKSQTNKSVRTKKEGQGTFLTGLGLSSEASKRKQSAQTQNRDLGPLYECSDPNEILKELVGQRGDDLEELRRLIRETSSNLQGCSKKLNKNKRSILQMADRYTCQLPSRTLNVLESYQQFQSKKLEDEDYYQRY